MDGWMDTEKFNRFNSSQSAKQQDRLVDLWNVGEQHHKGSVRRRTKTKFSHPLTPKKKSHIAGRVAEVIPISAGERLVSDGLCTVPDLQRT